MCHRGVSATIGVMGLVSGLVAGPCLAQSTARNPGTVQVAPNAVPAGVTEVHGQLGASINNPGLQQVFELSWRRPLTVSRSRWLSEAHIAIGGLTAFTPTQARAGAWVEIAPVSIVVFRAGVEPGYYFGTFNSLTSFDSRTDAFDPDSLRARGGAVSGTASRVYLTPTLRFRAGRFVGAMSANFEWWSSSAPGPFFYEPTRDTLLDVNGDRLTDITSAVLYEHPLESGGHLSAGVLHVLTRVNSQTLNQIQRFGVVSNRQFTGRVLKLAMPSVTVSVARYLDDPSKHGEWTAAGAIGFSVRRR